MVDFEVAQRLVQMQEALRRCTYHEIRKDGHHKSSEGSLSLSFCLPAVVSRGERPTWVVEAYSYLLNPDGRPSSWSGATALEAIAQAETAIEEWCFASEMEMMRHDMSIGDDDA